MLNDDARAIAWNVSVDQGGTSCVTVNDGCLTGMNVQRTFGGNGGQKVTAGNGICDIYNAFHLY